MSTYPHPKPSILPFVLVLFFFLFFFFISPLKCCRIYSRWWYQARISTRLALYLGVMEEQQRVSSPPAQSKVESYFTHSFPEVFSVSSQLHRGCAILTSSVDSVLRLRLWSYSGSLFRGQLSVWFLEPLIILPMRSCCNWFAVIGCQFALIHL